MDESAYRSARGGINRLPCVFEKALLLRCAACTLAQTHALAERETLACTEAAAHDACREFYKRLREKSLFALKLAAAPERIPHALETKLQCGGLSGLYGLQEEPGKPLDVHRLLATADVAELPYSRIIQGVAAWQGRKRAKPGEDA